MLTTKQDQAGVLQEIGQLAVALKSALQHIVRIDELGYEERPSENGYSLKHGPVHTGLDRFGEKCESVDWAEFRFELNGIRYNLQTAFDGLSSEFTRPIYQALRAAGMEDDPQMLAALDSKPEYIAG